MKGLQTPLSLGRRYIKNVWDGKTYVLLTPMLYLTRSNIYHEVPAGFVTDCASWVRRRGRFEEAAVMHDYLYSQQAGFMYANRIFKEMMERAGCARWRINLYYYGVCCFGWYAYHFGGK